MVHVVQITEKNLTRFRTWMLERGRTEGTADLYMLNVRSCGASPRGLTSRLISGDLAPNTARINLQSLRAWARFAKDAELRERLADIRLPPPRRLKSRQPLPLHLWRDVVQHIKVTSTLDDDEAMRHVLLIMATRGMRCSDVLRIRRIDIMRALDTGRLTYEGKGRKRIEIDAKPSRASLKELLEIGKLSHRAAGWVTLRDLVTPSGSPLIARKRVWRASRRVAKEIGIADMNPHRWRHTFATGFLAKLAGDPNALVKLQKHMAWESVATASRYVDAVSQAEMDVLGAGLVGDLLD